MNYFLLLRLYANNTTQAKQTSTSAPTVQTSWFKDNNMIMLMKIPENSLDSTASSSIGHYTTSSCSSSNNNNSCLNKNFSSTNSSARSTKSSDSCKNSEQCLTTKYRTASKQQQQQRLKQQYQQLRYQRTLSLPNIWLNAVRPEEFKPVLEKG